jgi:hypothetical protein
VLEVWHRVASGCLAASALVLVLRSCEAEWIVAAYLGGAHTDQTSLQVQMPGSATSLLIHPISYADRPFQSPLYYGYRAGYYFNRFHNHFGFQGEFTHLKVYAETDRVAQISGLLNGAPVNETAVVSSVVERFDITHGVNLLTGNFVFRQPLGAGGSSRFVFLARMGAGVTIPHPENEILGISNMQHYQVGSPVIHLGAGLEVRLLRAIYALTEIKYTRINETVDIAQGTGTSLLNSMHAIGGLEWHFK